MAARTRAGQADADEWLHMAVRYLARWDRTSAQVEHYLIGKGATPGQVSRVVERLADLRYLDDAAYAGRWIERRLARMPMGRERVKAELQGQGIADAVAEQAIGSVWTAGNDVALARQALQARQQRGRRLTPGQAERLLRQRGFDDETIDRVMGSQREREGLET